MRRWGSIRSLRKRSSHKISTEFWGATVKGEIGRVRAYREVTVPTMTLAVAILKQKSVTARVWVAAMLRRPSSFDRRRIFAALSAGSRCSGIRLAVANIF